MNKTIIQITKNVVSSWGMSILQAGIGLVMVPFLLGKMGKEGYGVIGVLMAIIGFSQIADLGLRAALNRELAEKVTHRDEVGFRSLSVSALVLYIGIALITALTGAIFAPALCSLFNVEGQHYDLMVILLRTYAPFTVLLSFITPVFTAGICSFMRYDIQNHVSMISNICISLMLFVFLSLFDGNPLIAWSAVMAGGALLRLGLMAIFYRRICFGGHISVRHLHFGSLMPLFRLGSSMYILQLTNVLAQRVDPLIISRFLGLGGVALYQAGSKLPQLVRPIVMAGINQMVPLTTRFHVSGNQLREQQTLILGTKYTLYLGGMFSAGMILFADSFCHLWLFDKLGEDVQTVALVLKMLAVISLFNFAGGAQWPLVLGKKKIRFSIWLALTTSVFNVILSVYLVGFTNIGVAGVLVGTVMTEIVRRPIAAWYVSWLVGMKLRRYVMLAYVIPTIYILLLILLGRLVVSFSNLADWGSLIVSGCVFGCGAMILLLGFEWRMARPHLLRVRDRLRA